MSFGKRIVPRRSKTVRDLDRGAPLTAIARLVRDLD
jgi:hypothetical protein